MTKNDKILLQCQTDKSLSKKKIQIQYIIYFISIKIDRLSNIVCTYQKQQQKLMSVRYYEKYKIFIIAMGKK